MDKRENIYSMKGFKKVFGFTVRQTFKNRGYLVSFIIFVLVMTFMGPIQYMGQRAGQGAAESGLEYSPTKIEVDNVYIYNQTPVSLDEKAVEDLYKTKDELKKENINKEKLTIYNLAQVGEISEDELLDGLKEKDVAVVISLDQEGYHIKSVMADESKVELDDADKIAEVINNDFDEKRLSDSDVSDDDIKMIFSGVDKGGVLSESDLKSEEQKTVGRQNYMFYMLGYSIIIFIVVSMSSSYIITSVTEEKQSKLVENLLVSVRPMALLMGKVIGMMSYVVLVLVCGAIGSNISNYVMKNVFDITNEEFGGQGFNFSIFKDFGISGGIILLVSIVLAFIAFGTISGLFGSTCNKTEDIQNATGNVMTVSMVCYFAAIASGAIDNNIVSLVGAIVPPLSFFTAPVAYVTGRISLPLLLLAFVLQIALIVFLVMLSAKSYRNLILSDSTTPKLKTIFKSAKM